jgi:ubiquinone/menaquinone biosynthesis C-methylase UbiE
LLSWSEVKALSAAGFRFAAHGRTHTRLDHCDEDTLESELRGSRDAIEQALGQACRMLAYPYGRTSDRVCCAAARHFSAAFGTRLDAATATQDPYELSRIDACYLRSRRDLNRLISGRWRGWLGRRRALRTLRAIAIGGIPDRPASRALPHGTGEPARRAEASRTGKGRRDRTTPTLRGRALTCPACRGELFGRDKGAACPACEQSYPMVAGLLDLRLESDRYLDLDAERAKAERLHALESSTDLMGLAEAYYAMTDDVIDHRRDRFLQHIAGAEARGEALAAHLPRGGRILEVGCGTGGLLVASARAGLAIEGVDIAARWLVVARRRLADRRLSVPLTVASAERLPWPDGRFDAVVADSVLEHLDDPARALREWARVLRPGGRLIVWSPNRFTLTTDPHVGLWGVGWLPRRWVPGYLRLWGKADWPPRTLSATEAERIAGSSGLVRIAVDAPEIPPEWARTRPPAQRLSIRAYSAARSVGPSRRLLRAVGPLWELSATKKGAA